MPNSTGRRMLILSMVVVVMVGSMSWGCGWSRVWVWVWRVSAACCRGAGAQFRGRSSGIAGVYLRGRRSEGMTQQREIGISESEKVILTVMVSVVMFGFIVLFVLESFAGVV